MSSPEDVLNLDDDDDNANWTKRSWDLDVYNVDDLRALLDRMGVSVADFKRKLVYRANVDKLPWLKKL